MKKLTYTATFLSLIVLVGCSKDFLDSKSNSNIIQPSTIEDCKELLENSYNYNATGALPLLASDEYYYLDDAGWQAALTATERQSYIWATDVYGGEVNIQDWNVPYQAIFNANNVLAALSEMTDSAASSDYSFVKGWAYFVRAYELFDLLRNYAPAYDSSSEDTDFGIPLKLNAGIDNIEPRAPLGKCYSQVLSDVKNALALLPATYPTGHLNHPSRISAYGLIARIFLSMRAYKEAGLYADSSLQLYHTLVDFNGLSKTSSRPFQNNTSESIYTSTLVVSQYSAPLVSDIGQKISIDTTLLRMYAPEDLRLSIFYNTTQEKTLVKCGYQGRGSYPYTGLAVDEMYLIRAEAAARQGKQEEALVDLNTLLFKRYISGTYQILNAFNTTNVLRKVLNERRKELVWRGLRWSDLKRLNKDGAAITLTRVLNGQENILLPNDPKYVFNIPSDEIALSGILQNVR